MIFTIYYIGPLQSTEDLEFKQVLRSHWCVQLPKSRKWPPTAGAPYEPLSESTPLPLSGLVSPLDVDLLEEVTNESWRGECAVYAFYSGHTTTLFQYETCGYTYHFLRVSQLYYIFSIQLLVLSFYKVD